MVQNILIKEKLYIKYNVTFDCCPIIAHKQTISSLENRSLPLGDGTSITFPFKFPKKNIHLSTT